MKPFLKQIKFKSTDANNLISFKYFSSVIQSTKISDNE